MKLWEKFTRQQIEEFVKDSYSYASLAKKIGYNIDGHYVYRIKNMVEELGFDVSHFTCQGWNKNNFDYSRFQYGKAIKAATALSAIIALRGHKCEMCGLETWNDKLIPLEVHHIDGDSLNSELDNLQLLCPNCHATTDNYKGKNQVNHGNKIISDEDLINALRISTNIRQALLSVGLTAKGGNYKRAYELICKYNIQNLM